MKVLVVGSGGREHCLSWKIAQQDRVKEIFCAPGNGGTDGIAQNIHIPADQIKSLAEFATEKKIDLTVVGPEIPLVGGIVDEFQRRGLKVFGPKAELALLEGSKVFAKEKMHQFSVPTADFGVFNDYIQAQNYVRERGAPIVIKADGLAAGKGVFVCGSIDEALSALKAIMVDKQFGDSGEKVLVEECLSGEEASLLILCDGKHMIPLASSQDHKRIFDGDRGPNTGGMGAYSPAPLVNDVLWQKINFEILEPLVKGLNSEGTRYTGVLYVGLMMTPSGPKVLEFNVRFGDPETQAVIPRLKNDLVEVMVAATEGTLNKINLQWDERAAICVVVSSGGYPGSYEKHKEIFGLAALKREKDTFAFHAGTKKEGEKYFTSGGRVLNIVSLGQTLEDAKNKVYGAIEKINFEKMYFRKDIGWRAL